MNAWTSNGKLVEATSTARFEPLPREPGAIDIHVRSYRVEFKRDHRADAAGLDWRLYTYGPGHWCEGTGHSATFQTEAEAIDEGKRWVATGGPASDRAEHHRSFSNRSAAA